MRNPVSAALNGRSSFPGRALVASVSFAWFLCLSSSVWSAVEWQSGAGFRSARLPVPASGKTGFAELEPAVTGITFTNHLSKETAGANQILLNGSGVAAGDVDGDGQCDLYFCRLKGRTSYRNLGIEVCRHHRRRRGLQRPILHRRRLRGLGRRWRSRFARQLGRRWDDVSATTASPLHGGFAGRIDSIGSTSWRWRILMATAISISTSRIIEPRRFGHRFRTAQSKRTADGEAEDRERLYFTPEASSANTAKWMWFI